MRSSLGKVLCMGLLLAVGVSCGGGGTPQETLSTKEKITPKKTDNYKDLMVRELENFNYISYGYFNFDPNQVKEAADNFVTIGTLLADSIPASYRSKAAEWKEYCEKQADIAENIKQAYASRDFEGARNHYHELLQVCMGCHSLYRKHLGQEAQQ